MLLGGDECGRTQRGNNNAYCQDNEISSYDWDRVDRDLLRFTRHLVGCGASIITTGGTTLHPGRFRCGAPSTLAGASPGSRPR